MNNSLNLNRDRNGHLQTADKIFNRLKLLDKEQGKNQARLVWELVQNACDSTTDDSLDIEIHFGKDSFSFLHNGGYFSESNISGLIDQISSKDVVKGSPSLNIGRFGTGFMTTHAISKKVDVSGVMAKGRRYYSFDMKLDRTGDSRHDVLAKLDESWSSLSDNIRPIRKNEIPNLHTKFIYSNTSTNFTQKDLVDDISSVLPLLFITARKINTFKIYSDGVLLDKYRKTLNRLEDEGVSQVQVTCSNHANIESVYTYLVSEKNDIQVIIPIVETQLEGEESYQWVIDNMDSLPKIFCAFPISGSEKFTFPAIINSSNFYPKLERDGIWLTSDSSDDEVMTNKSIIEQSIPLYSDILKFCVARNIGQIYNAINFSSSNSYFKSIDHKWYNQKIIVSLFESVKDLPIVPLSYDNYPLGTIVDGGGEDNLYAQLPYYKNSEDREHLWEVLFDMGVRTMPKKNELHEWHSKLNRLESVFKIDAESLLVHLQGNYENVYEICEHLNIHQSDAIGLLDDIISFIQKVGRETHDSADNEGSILDKYSVYCNQVGDLCLRSELYRDKVNDKDIVKILADLGDDWAHRFLATGHNQKFVNKDLTFDDIAAEINEKIDDETTPGRKKAIAGLCQWFDDNHDIASKYFYKHYSGREKLFMDTLNDKDRESLYKIMKSDVNMTDLLNYVNSTETNDKGGPDQSLTENDEHSTSSAWEPTTPIQSGNIGEELVRECLKDEFQIVKEHHGRDFVILGRDGEQEFSLEVKVSLSGGDVRMSYLQAKKAAINSKYYALCVVPSDGTKLTKDYILHNSVFITNIGDLLKDHVYSFDDWRDNPGALPDRKDGITIELANKNDTRFFISKKIWSKGLSISEYKDSL